jgi:bifunctional DNA-binding transcriptional regulator/antitoxin component of YhaV-PrlF toxin-antitoxin module
MATTMTSKSRVTVPKNVREFLGLGPSSNIHFELRPNGEVVMRAATAGRRPLRGRFERLRGCATVKVSTDEILALTRGA